MKILLDVAAKRLSECDKGDLLSVGIGGKACWAIHLGSTGYGESKLALLNPSHENLDSPAMNIQNSTTWALSRGSNWCLKPIAGDESFMGNQRYLEVPGSLHLTEGDWTIGIKSGSSMLDVNLLTAAMNGTLGSRSVPFLRWEIWASEAAVSTPGCHPLLSMDVRPDA